VHSAPLRPTRATASRGIPPKGEDKIEGALASSLAFRQTLLGAKSCCIVATNACDATARPATESWSGSKGRARRNGGPLSQSPRFLAASLSLKKPARILALLLVMTVCLLVYAALEYRIRQALRAQQETFPDQKGRRVQHPTARWVFHDFGGIHVLLGVAQEPLGFNLHEEHQLILRLLCTAYEALYS
jgi:hypothetical protein